MSDLFLIGASGTKAYRAAMAAISENIANASTEGYARRSVSTVESPASAATMQLYVPRTMFGGTMIGGVNRATDPYLDAAVRMTSTALGSSTARLRWLTDTETALNDSSTGVGALMTGMYQNLEKLAASPSNTSLRVTVLDSVGRVADAFRQTAADLNTTAKGIATDASGSLQTINTALNSLADINLSLLRAQPGTSAYAQLLDGRDAALHDLSANLNIDISFGAHDNVQISFNGQQLVSGTDVTTLAVTSNANGTLALATSGGTALTAPSSGTLGGLFAAADTVAERHASLDVLANQFATSMNAWHAQGRTDAMTAGQPLLSGTSAATLTALSTEPAELAVRSADGTQNGNLLAVGTSLRGAGSVEQGWSSLIAMHANLLAATSAEQKTAQGRSDQAVAAREAVSGVDLDMEAADLLRLQQAYSASAKVLQIAKETLDSIFQLI